MILCGWLAAIIGGIWSIGALMDSGSYYLWSDIESMLLEFLFSGFLLFAGVIALLKMKRNKEKTEVLEFDQVDPKTQAPKSGKVTEESIVKAIREGRDQSQ